MEKANPKGLKICQKFGWLILRPILNFFTGYRLRSDCDLKSLKAPVIIVSNHTSHADSSLLGTALPFFCPIYPLYFMAVDRFFNNGFKGGLLKLLGAFPANKKEGFEKSLATPKKILAGGHSLVLFPESHRRTMFNVSEGRAGAAILALEAQAPVLPAAILGISEFSWKKFLTRKYRVRVKIGRPFLLTEKLAGLKPETDRVGQGTKIIMEEIKKLMDQS